MKKCFFCLLVAISLTITPSVLAQNPQRGMSVVSEPSIWGRYYALIIGINDYKEWPRLRTAVKDATVIRDILVSRYGFSKKNVILRTNQKASRLQIIRDLRYLAKSMVENDNLFIYYAGHGQLDDLTGDGYWIPPEGQLKNPGTWVANSYIKAVLSSEKVQAKNVVVIADSCYSGSLLRGGPSPMSLDDQRYSQKLAKQASLRSRQVISSGGVEPVADGGAGGHSLFAFYLIDALKKNNREVIDLENLFHTKVWKPVTEIGNQRPNVGRLKTPMDQDGQFVLYNAAWVKEQTSRQAALEAKKQEGAGARQTVAAASAELEMQRQRFEIEKQKLAIEKEQLAQQKALEVERLKFEKQKQEFEYAKLQARLEEMESKRKENELHGKPKAVVAEQQGLYAAVDQGSLNNRMATQNSYSLAIFPFYLYADSYPRGYPVSSVEYDGITSIYKVVDNDDRLTLKYTYKAVKNNTEGSALLKDALGENTINIYKRTSLFSTKDPDWDAVKRIGKKIEVDLAILIVGSLTPPDQTCYLYDLNNSKIYAKKTRAQFHTISSRVESAMNALVKDFFRNK